MGAFVATTFKKKKKDKGSSFGANIIINNITANNTISIAIIIPPPSFLKVMKVLTNEPTKSTKVESGKRQLGIIELANKRLKTEGQELERNKGVVGESDLFTSHW